RCLMRTTPSLLLSLSLHAALPILSSCFSDLDFLARALDACLGAALRKRDIEGVAGSKTPAPQHDPARAVPHDAVAALQHCRRIRSEERRVGKSWRARWWPEGENKE